MRSVHGYLLAVSLALGMVSAVLSGAALHEVRKGHRPVTISAPVGMTEKQARRLELTKWPELEQVDVYAITATLRKLPVQPPAAVTVSCFDETKCGDLASSLENAFESGHAPVEVRYAPAMIPPGVTVSSKSLLDVLGAAGERLGAVLDPTPEEGNYIWIGEKPRS